MGGLAKTDDHRRAPCCARQPREKSFERGIRREAHAVSRRRRGCHGLSDRRRRRVAGRRAKGRRSRARLWRRDLSAPDCADFARGTNLPGDHDSDRPPLPPRLNPPRKRFGENGRIPAMIRTLPALVACSLIAAFPAAAETPAPPSSAQAVQKSEREKELKLLRRDLQTSREHEAKLKAEIDKIKNDRAKLSKALVDSAANTRALEAKMTAAEAKLEPLDLREAEIRNSLHERRDALANVLAVMQRIGSSPAPSLLLQPDEALKSVRAAILLGAVVPEMRAQADRLV